MGFFQRQINRVAEPQQRPSDNAWCAGIPLIAQKSVYKEQTLTVCSVETHCNAVSADVLFLAPIAVIQCFHKQLSMIPLTRQVVHRDRQPAMDDHIND